MRLDWFEAGMLCLVTGFVGFGVGLLMARENPNPKHDVRVVYTAGFRDGLQFGADMVIKHAEPDYMGRINEGLRTRYGLGPVQLQPNLPAVPAEVSF